MGESEDENYVTFGTALDPLDEDNLPRKKPMTIKDQYALDEQGRRRFHGAFTGGFSAGYFNTVGTRDGWRPQQFKSSRGSKAENKAQKPEDFMDDEDVGEFGIAPTAIRATNDYTDHDKRGTKRERNSHIGDGPIPGTPVLQELLKPVKDTVGVKLLKQMGWKPGQGVGPRLSRKEKSKVKQQNDKQKIYGCPLPPEQGEKMETDSEGSEDEENSVTFAPDDYEPFRCNPKDNFFGIGYSGLDKRPILSQHVNLFEPTTFKLQEKNKKLSIRGQAFGVGGFEVEDEDIYSRDDMSQYDFSLEPQSREKSRWSKEKLGGASERKCIQGFLPAKNSLKIGQIFKAPDLPQGFKPVHVVRKSRFEPSIGSTSLENARRQGLARHDLRAEDRARIINDPNPITLVLSSDSAKPDQRPRNDSLFPTRVAEEQKVRPESSTQKMNLDSSDEQRAKKPSVISNIITKTLNLHGREQAARNVERCEKKTALTDSTVKNSWLDKLNVKSFVKGGVENLTTGEETDDKNRTGDDDRLTQQENVAGSVSDENTEREADDSGGSLFRPFVGNPDKQKRYDKFLALCKSGEKSKLCDIQPLSMTEWEREHERVEFEQAARLYKPLTGSMGDRFVSGKHQDDLNPLKIVEKTKDGDSELREAAANKMFGKLTRQRIDWQPASILCKRFNIAEPRTRCVKQEVEKKTKFSVFDYLEESVHNSSTFQSATDVAVRLKSENFNGISRQEGSRNRLPESRITDSAMLICDNADREKVSAKERNFEAKYERIFGKNVETIEKGDKNISPRAQIGGKLSENFEDAEPIELLEDSSKRRNFPGPSDTIENVESADNLTIKTDEKKDLFKAIFLSSSEDSDSEKEEEVDDEKLKSVLIGKNSGDLNVKRNTSPPRGIFANLDLDSLQNDSSGRNSKINLVEKDHPRSNLDGDIETTKVSARDRNTDDGTKKGAKDSENSTGVKVESDLEILPDMYGPILPSKPVNNPKDMVNIQQETSSQSQAPKYVFKSIVVPVVKPVSSSSLDGEWIEKRKSKKSKKEKKKHKHKEHKKHKHKKHKR